MNKLIILGTSHLTDRYNPIRYLLSGIFRIKIENYAIPSLGIETYFPRLLSILKKHKDKNLNFLLELPCHGRYEEYLSTDYKALDMLNLDFWAQDLGKHISFYNLSKLNNSEFKRYVYDKQVTSSLLKLKTLTNKTIEREHVFEKAVIIDGFLKNLGHTVTWVTVDNHILKDCPTLRQDFADFNIITETPLHQIIIEKYGYKDVKDLYNSNQEMFLKLFPDTSHLIEPEWQFLIKEYIVPYFESVSTGS